MPHGRQLQSAQITLALRLLPADKSRRKVLCMKVILNIVIALASLYVGFFGTSASAQQYNKLWWGTATQNGMGTPISHQIKVLADGSKQDIIFGVWFHYSANGDPTWLTFTCNPLVKDALLRDSCTGQLVRVRGSQPTGYDPSKVSVTLPGTFTITFMSENWATFVYNFEGQSGALTWVPQTFGSELVYGIWSLGAYPFLVTKTGVTKVVNKTQYQAGAFPLFNCALGYPQLSDGKILTQCTTAVATASTPANTRVLSYIDPSNNELRDFLGSVPANNTWRVIEKTDNKPEWSSKARVADGWYYTPFDSDWELYFLPDIGSSFTVKKGTLAGDGNLNIMVRYPSLK